MTCNISLFFFFIANTDHRLTLSKNYEGHANFTMQVMYNWCINQTNEESKSFHRNFIWYQKIERKQIETKIDLSFLFFVCFFFFVSHTLHN